MPAVVADDISASADVAAVGLWATRLRCPQIHQPGRLSDKTSPRYTPEAPTVSADEPEIEVGLRTAGNRGHVVQPADGTLLGHRYLQGAVMRDAVGPCRRMLRQTS